MLPNVLPVEASHRSLNKIERAPLLITFDTSFEQKFAPIFTPNRLSLEFEIMGDQTNFLDLRNFSLEVKCQITNSEGSNLDYHATDATQRDMPTFANNPLHPLFSDYCHCKWYQSFLCQ